MKEEHTSESLAGSSRFRLPERRRDFLGMAAIWSAAAAFAASVIGAIRLPMPAVFPESNSKTKIGPPDAYPKGSTTELVHLQLWVHHDDEGLYAISSVCTHLGCIATREENGEFRCPCHGSVFSAGGKVMAGPAPKGLNWLALNIAPDGQLEVDTMRFVPMGTRLKA